MQRRNVRIEYSDLAERSSARTVWPLGLYFWGTTWCIGMWCEARSGFRSFRLDRMRGIKPTGETFEETPGRTLDDFVKSRQLT